MEASVKYSRHTWRRTITRLWLRQQQTATYKCRTQMKKAASPSFVVARKVSSRTHMHVVAVHSTDWSNDSRVSAYSRVDSLSRLPES